MKYGGVVWKDKEDVYDRKSGWWVPTGKYVFEDLEQTDTKK